MRLLLKTVLAVAMIGAVFPAAAQTTPGPVHCGDLPDAAKTACREAFELLTRDTGAEDAEIVVAVTADTQGWRHEYRLPPTADSTGLTCIVPGPINLRRDGDTRLLVTASDTIHTWQVPALDLKIDAIPGRIDELTIHPTKEGRFAGHLSDGGGTPPEMLVMAPDAYEVWQRETLVKSCR